MPQGEQPEVEKQGTDEDFLGQGLINWQQTAEAKQRLYEQAYRELAMTITGKAPADPPPDEDSFLQMVTEHLERNRDKIHDRVCVKMQYCAVMQRNDWWAFSIPLMVSVATVLFEVLGGFGIVSTTWLFSKGVLDRFCGCNPRK